MNRWIVITACFGLALALAKSSGQGRFERIRSPYAAAPPFSQTMQPPVEEIARPAEPTMQSKNLSENPAQRAGQAHFAPKNPQNEPGPGGFRDSESNRRPEIESLLNELEEARGELHLKLESIRNLGQLEGQSATPYVERIESILQIAQAKRRDETRETNQLLRQLDVLLSLPTAVAQQNGPADRKSADKAGSAPSPGEKESGPSQEDEAATGTPVDLAGEAVDRLHLADALFGRNEYKLARDIYLKLYDLPVYAHGHDRVWIEFQIASCCRNLDDIGNAEKYYRMVVGTEEETDFAEYARWWLEAIQKGKNAERVLEEIRQSVPEERQTNGTDKSDE